MTINCQFSEAQVIASQYRSLMGKPLQDALSFSSTSRVIHAEVHVYFESVARVFDISEECREEMICKVKERIWLVDQIFAIAPATSRVGRYAQEHLGNAHPEISSLSPIQIEAVYTRKKEDDLLSFANEIAKSAPAFNQFGNQVFTNPEDAKAFLNEPNHQATFALIRILNLAVLKLFFLPSDIGRMTNLRDLMLDRNYLRTLPDEIGALRLLEGLWLPNNQLNSLPEEIGGLVSLQKLDLNDNQLRYLPKEIGELRNLRELSLIHNQLRALPREMRNLRRLEKLRVYSVINLPVKLILFIFRLRDLL